LLKVTNAMNISSNSRVKSLFCTFAGLYDGGADDGGSFEAIAAAEDGEVDGNEGGKDPLPPVPPPPPLLLYVVGGGC
jgi:hypothetical protein